MLIHERSTPISAAMAEILDVYFEESEIIGWSIHQDALTGDYRLLGHFESQEMADDAWVALKTVFSTLPESCETQVLQPESWQEAYKVYLQPWSYHELHWVPAWEWDNYKLPEGHVALKLDPGMAFGTGSHETTRLVAQRLLRLKHDLSKEAAKVHVLDAGCGSGILALSAYLLGFGHVKGFDIDPEAVRISQENRDLNAISPEAVHFYTAGLPGGLMGKPVDCLLANIQTEILIPQAQSLIEAIAPSGALILSGILNKEIATVIEAYKPLAEAHWGQFELDSQSMGEWSDLYLKRA